MIVPLSSSLGDRVRPSLKKKKKSKRENKDMKQRNTAAVDIQQQINNDEWAQIEEDVRQRKIKLD